MQILGALMQMAAMAAARSCAQVPDVPQMCHTTCGKHCLLKQNSASHRKV